LLSEAILKDLLHAEQLSRVDKALLCLAAANGETASVQEVTAIAEAAGLRAAKGWNVSNLLARSKGSAIRTRRGWELAPRGRCRIEELTQHTPGSAPIKSAGTLRKLLPKFGNGETAEFVEEAIRCLEAGLYRAAVVLSWIGAISVLYNHVIQSRLAEFNVEARRRNVKWQDAQTSDGLARMREHEFLQVIEAISVIGKSVKDELETGLRLRNGCGHPNSLRVRENRVLAHLESLILNVFDPFT
jgi:hypothetical protein